MLCIEFHVAHKQKIFLPKLPTPHKRLSRPATNNYSPENCISHKVLTEFTMQATVTHNMYSIRFAFSRNS